MIMRGTYGLDKKKKDLIGILKFKTQTHTASLFLALSQFFAFLFSLSLSLFQYFVVLWILCGSANQMGALFSGVGAKFYLGGPLYLSLFSPTLVLLEFLIIIIIFLGMVFNFSLMCVFFFFALFGSYLIEEVEVGGGALKKGLGGSWRSPLHKPVTGKGRYAHVLTGGRVWRGAVPL